MRIVRVVSIVCLCTKRFHPLVRNHLDSSTHTISSTMLRENKTKRCDMNYTAKNLPFSVSYKAIIDIRLSWGVGIAPDPRYSRFPHWYKPVQVCVFCSQFFQLKGGIFDSPDRVRHDYFVRTFVDIYVRTVFLMCS